MRMTRAALRAQESEEALKAELDIHLTKQDTFEVADNVFIHEDSDRENSSLVSINDTSADSDRIVLKDITTENYPILDAADEMQGNMVTELKKVKSVKGKTKKQKAKQGGMSEKQPALPVKCLSTESTTELNSSPIGAAATTQETPFDVVDLHIPQKDTEENSSSELDQQDATADMFTACEPKTSSTESEGDVKTPEFIPEIHGPETDSFGPMVDSEDSFVAAIKARSPSKHDSTCAYTTMVDSSLVNTTSHTPAKPISSPRVEDSVAALDALEDAIEKFAEVLPSLDSISIESPTRTRTFPAKAPLKTPSMSTAKTSTSKTSPIKTATTSNPKKSLAEKLADAKRTSVKERVKAIEARPNPATHRRATSVVVTKPSTTVPKPATRPGHAPSKSVSAMAGKTAVTFSNSPIKVQPSLAKKRVTSGPLSTAKPGFVPAKSSKPPTTSDFVLPGEAIAAKLKARREERLKREEAAMAKKSNISAKNNLVKTTKPSVVPRDNKASLARLSVMKNKEGENKENVAPSKIVSSNPSIEATKANTNEPKPESGSRNPSAVVSGAGAAKRLSTVTARIVSDSSMASTTSASNTGKTANKGKEVYGRHRQTLAEQQREKKEKEEAAKKARADAAEKGRLASREWAEKQKRRLIAAQDAKAKAERRSITVE